MNDDPQIYTEGEKSFLSIFSNCLKLQTLDEPHQKRTEISGQTLLELPLHLLYSLYMLKYLNARDSTIKLLYTLNVFRAVQKRLALDMREMGSRDRVMGDSIFLGPMEVQQYLGPTLGGGEGRQATSQGDKASADNTHRSISGGKPDQSVFYDTNYSHLYKVDVGAGSPLKNKAQPQVIKQADEPIDIINDNMIDIFKIRFNGRLQNLVYSSNPILPRFHSAFGEPVTRQDISSEMEGQKNSDNKKEEGKKLLGRVDNIIFDQHTGYYFVKDDWGKHIMYDSAQLDLKLLSEEVLKIVSFYINKQEPVLAESDLRNTFPAVDRFQLIQEAFDYELRYQNAKTELVLSYLECFEHISEMLEQQRMVQIITDLMAVRPRLNLRGTHFKDSYRAEIDCLTLQTEIIREMMRMQMKSEFDANNSIREYLERTYRLVMDQADSKFVYQKPEGLDQELKTRENLQKGLTEDANQALTKQPTVKNPEGGAEQPAEQEQPKFTSAKFSDPKEFAAYLGIPFASLQMLMKDHKERDPMVQQTIHEHVSFIKIEEGYPVFMYDMSAKLNNTVMYTNQSQRIGMLDFYDSLAIMVKIVAAIKGSVEELKDTHHPDNGLTSSALELATLRFIQAELKIIKGERQLLIAPQKEGMPYLEDDSIVGNSDRMLFYVKEFAASGEDEQASHNPYILTKLNLKTITNYSFEAFQRLLLENQAKGVSDDLQDDLQKRRKINQHHAYRFFPKLKARAQKIFIPSMLYLTCNSIEVLRLRSLLTSALLQTELLEQVYIKQSRFLNKEAILYFKDPFNFQTFIDFADKNYINFVDEGPASGIDIGLAINEFDPTLRTHMNFTDPDSFKMMISPMGLEELRLVLMYQLMHLHTLMIATKINQQLLDVPMREVTEIDLLIEHDTVLPNPTLDYFSKLQGSFVNEGMLKKQIQHERIQLVSRTQSSLHELYQSVIAKKNRSKIMVQNLFQKSRLEIVDPQEKQEVQLRKLRTYRVTLCQDYCLDILTEVYSDAIRLQLIDQCNQLRQRSFLLPKEQIFLQVSGTQGEYRSYYNQLPATLNNTTFLDEHSKSGKISGGFWKLPSNYEILKQIDVGMYERLREHDFPLVYVFKNEKGQKMIPDVRKNTQSKLVVRRLPLLAKLDYKDTEHLIKRKKRFVDYGNSLSFEQYPILQVLKYFTNVQNLLDLEFFQTKLQTASQTMAELEQCVMSGMPFWDIPEDTLLGLLPDQEDPAIIALGGDGIDNIANLGYKNLLAKKVVEKLAQEKRAKLTLNQELESGVADRFKDISKTMQRLELFESVEKAAQFLADHVTISFYSVLASLGQVGDKLCTSTDILEVISRLSHLNDAKVTYTNGFHVNHALTNTLSLCIDPNNKDAHEDFMRCAQPVIDEKALIPSQLTLIDGLFTSQAHSLVSNKKGHRGYAGKLQGRDYQYLDYALVNIERGERKQIQQHIASCNHQVQEFIRVKCGATHEVLNVSTLEYVSEMLHESQTYLRSLIRARHLKRVVLILINNQMIPSSDPKLLQQMQRKFSEEVQWKINLASDEKQFEKIKQAQKVKQDHHDKLQKAQEEGTSTASIVQAMKKQNEKTMSNALQQYEQAHCEIEVLQDELHRFLLKTAFRLLDQESAALARCFEMNGKQFEFYIHPCQQFASTPNQQVDKRNHLDPINKVSFAQKFLTQIRNRCLEIETLTSGVGVVISKKDLNECLEEACRSILKTCEVEMRTRCETNALLMVHYDNLLYIKDQQLANMEMKLTHAKGELDKIIRTKVFSRGKQLVYELDFNSRQLRMLKDNLYSMEHRLTEEINIAYERELNQTRMELEQSRRKFSDFQVQLNTVVTADVRDNINSIDQIMKGKAEFFKDVKRQLPHQQGYHPTDQSGASTTINIGSVVIQNFSRQQSNLKSANDQGQQLQAHQLIIGELEAQILSLQKQLKEFSRLRHSEKKAHASILQLQDLIRKQRVLSRFKEVLLRQRYEHELDNLRAQLNSNTELWQQLAESQKREAIIKADLDGVQQHIITQEKIIEQLKDELRLEKIEKTKLMQYKITKSRRLEDLEGKAREFEVMSNLNLPKMVSMLESRDTQIDQMKTNMKLNEAHISSTLKQREIEVLSYRRRIEAESKIKGEALVKLENLRHELQLIEGGTDIGIADVWKDKCRKLVDICKSFKEENDRLQLQQSIVNPSVHSSNTQQDMLSEGSNSLLEQSMNLSKHHRFKKKIDLMGKQQKQQATLLQNQSFAAAPHQHSVLGGGNITGNFSQSLERVQSNSIKLPKLQHKPTAARDVNIFQAEVVLPVADTVETLKTPLRTIYDQESHISSIQQNLDPMYDPSNSRMAMQKSGLRNMERQETNVFASLKEETAKLHEQNLSMHTSGTVLADYNHNYSALPSQYLQQVSIPPEIMSQPQVFDNPSFAQTQFSRNQANVFMSNNTNANNAALTVGMQGPAQNMFGTNKSDGKYRSAERGSQKPKTIRGTHGYIHGSGGHAKHIDIANIVRAKLMSPPRALQRDVEHSGFRGYNVLKKKESE